MLNKYFNGCFVVVIIVVLPVLVWGACPAYTFEELPAGTVVTTQYMGVTFSAPAVGGACTGQTYIRDISSFGGTSSPPQALTTRAGSGCEFSPEYLRMDFAKNQKDVSFTLGFYCGDYAIRGYNSRGSLILSFTVSIPGCTTLHGVHRFVQVSYPTNSISRIEIDGGSGAAETIDDLLFDIDTTAPLADIYYPTYENCACESVGIWGTACDPDDTFQRYTLEYREVASATWSLIGEYTSPVCSLGVLAIWNTSALAQGYYFIRLTAENACGLTTSDIATIWVDRSFSSLDLRSPVSGGIYGNTVCFEGTVWDNHCFDYYTVMYDPTGSGEWQPINPDMSTYNTTTINDPFAYWDTVGTAVPDGTYRVRVEAFDACGNTAVAVRKVTIDNTWPKARITNPGQCDYVRGLVLITGTASDANLDNWVLQVTGGPYIGWVTLASGSTSIINGILAAWDTTGLESCAYTLRLIATDKAVLDCDNDHRHRTEWTTSIHIGLSADINGDGKVDMQDVAELSSQWLMSMP